MLFQRTKVRRFRRTREAEQASAWLARCADTNADTVTLPAVGGHLPAARPTVRPGTPFTRSAPAARPRPRVVAGNRPAAAPRRQLAPVPPPAIPALPTARAAQPSPTAPNPAAIAQTMPGRTYVLTVPPAPTYAERLAAVFDAAAEKFTVLSGWVYNTTVDDTAVTKNRFRQLRDRFADFLPPLPALELAAA